MQPITHVQRLNSISKLELEKFSGPDADLATSLFEYGFAFKEIEDNELLVIYRHTSIEGKFDRCTVKRDLDVFKEYDWIKWEDFFSFLGLTKEQWTESCPLSQKLYDLVNYHGEENIFGTSYWEGFAIEEN